MSPNFPAMHRVTDEIYVGAIRAVSQVALSNPEGITDILNCTENYYRAPKGIKQCWFLSMPDESQCHYSIVLFGVRCIHEAVSRRDKILVHCRGGVSRSRALVAAYLVLCCGKTWADAKAEVLSKRKFYGRLDHINPKVESSVLNAIEIARRIRVRKGAA